MRAIGLCRSRGQLSQRVLRVMVWVMMAYGLGRRVVLAGSLRAEGLQAKCSHLDHRPSAGLLIACVTGTPRNPNEPDAALRLVTVAAVDVKRAADLYHQGQSLRQIGAELGVPWAP
jgi:hypothetical protein